MQVSVRTVSCQLGAYDDGWESEEMVEAVCLSRVHSSIVPSLTATCHKQLPSCIRSAMNGYHTGLRH